MIETFVWSDRFASGIDSVDSQHKQLFHLINQIGDLMVEGAETSDTAIAALIKQLADYVRFHFTDEERVMIEGGLDPAYIDAHKAIHKSFTEQVLAMWKGRASLNDPVKTLYGFLSSWLVYHILGEDQNMARQLRRVGSGVAPGEAYKLEAASDEASSSALLTAMRTLYDVVTKQNRTLADINVVLEARVAERTAQLNDTYTKLATEHLKLTESMKKVDDAQNALLQSEKMAAIGQLAAGVAHEINNPIGFVSSNLGTLNRYVNDLLRLAEVAADSPVAKEIDLPFLREDVPVLLSESRDGLDRVRKIVSNLKDFAHVDEAEWQDADLIAGLESTVNVAAHELRYKAEIVRQLEPLPRVRCIPAQINQVFLNLLVNAAQSIAEHGQIALSSGIESQSEKPQVWIEIADTGKGMDAETMRRMFEPFFTTKPVGQGTGLGMSLSYDIIKKHGGRIDVDSTPGVGTRIRLWLVPDGPSSVP